MAAFQKAQDRLASEGIRVVAGSTDPLEKARGTVEALRLTYPVAYGLPLGATARVLGAFYDPERGILQATGFVVRPDGTIAVSLYSSGPLGRLVWQDVLSAIQYWKTSD